MKKVGIIGGSGFIGSYITKAFLNNGFLVKVSATDITREDKYQHLVTLNHSDNLHICELDVMNKSALQEFVFDCDIIIHSGTPFQLDVKDVQTELFDPTIKGTENFLEVISKTPGIEKVVLISSVASYNTNFPMLPDGKKEGDKIDEKDTPFTSDQCIPYAQAKFIANQVVEKFILENPKLDFEITSVSPTGVMGKSLSSREDSTSTGIQFLFKNKIAPNPFIQMLYDNDVLWALIDVQDVAQAIYKAAITKNTHGKNYLLSSESYKISDITLMLNQQEPLQKSVVVYKNDLAKKELKMDFKPVKECLNNY